MSSTPAHLHRYLQLRSLTAKQFHTCAFFHTPAEESRILSLFFSDAFEHGESACELIHPDLLERHLHQLESAGFPVVQAQQQRQLELRSWPAALVPGDKVDQKSMLALIQSVLDDRHARGIALTRLVAHMDWALEAGLEIGDLLEYEALLDRLQRGLGDPILCSYDLSKWSGRLIADVMLASRVAIVGNVLHENPFRSQPHTLLPAATSSAREPLDDALAFDLETLPRAGRELSACLVHLLALPALWQGGDAQTIVDVVLDAIVSMLHLDLGYVEIERSGAHEGLHATRIAGWNGPLPVGLSSALAPCMSDAVQPVTIAHPGGQGSLYSTCIPVGLDGTNALVAASARPGFPSTSEKLILLLAANQICTGIGQTRAAHERERVHRERSDSLFGADEHARALASLVDAAIAINATGTLQAVLQVVAQRAREVFGAERAVAIISAGVDWAQASYATALAEDAQPAREDPRPAGVRLHALVSRTRRPLRLTRAELNAFGLPQHQTANDLMAIALIGESGVNLGLLELSNKQKGDFDARDEDLLLRFAHVASIAIESRLVQERTRLLYESERRAREQAEETLHYNEIFAGILAHDLRSPLNAILTTAQLTLRRPESEQSARPMRRIAASGERMLRLIEQLLDFTRVRVGGGIDLRPDAVDLLQLFRSVLGELEVAHPDWSLHLHALGDLRGSWDPDRLTQVISNLVDNAVQHGAREGGLRVELDGANPDYVLARVHNQGGIENADVAQLFEPFRHARTRRDASAGLGLGLFIAQQIVRAHAGEIAVDSSAASGTTLTVRLPRHAGRPGAVHASGGPTQPAARE